MSPTFADAKQNPPSDLSRSNTIVFDLGAVLIDWNPRYLYRQLIHDEKEMERFLTEVCDHDWNVQQDAGRLFSDGVSERIKKFPQHAELIRAYQDRWVEMVAGPIGESVDILKELHAQAKCRLLALTNWSNETFPYALKTFDFLQLFEGIVVSGDEKLIKPDPRIYQILIERYGVEPSRAVFIDDSEKNVRAAENLGFHALHFISAEKLRRDLDPILSIQ